MLNPPTQAPTGLEVEVWFICPTPSDAHELALAREAMDRQGAVLPPPPGYRKLALTWEHFTTEPESEPWADAQAFGIAQAHHVLVMAASHDIPTELYAVRVQPLDAEFLPAAPAVACPRGGGWVSDGAGGASCGCCGAPMPDDTEEAA